MVAALRLKTLDVAGRQCPRCAEGRPPLRVSFEEPPIDGGVWFHVTARHGVEACGAPAVWNTFDVARRDLRDDPAADIIVN